MSSDGGANRIGEVTGGVHGPCPLADVPERRVPISIGLVGVSIRRPIRNSLGTFLAP